MNINMGKADRVFRVIAALVIGALYFAGMMTGVAAIILLAIAVVFVATSFVGVCPLYLPFNISTKKKA
jgi:K+-transporting ATPase A subunit